MYECVSECMCVSVLISRIMRSCRSKFVGVCVNEHVRDCVVMDKRMCELA